jgi:hypothetical protein
MSINLPSEGSIPGKVLGTEVRRSRTCVPQRICEVEGGTTVLSTYNAKTRCAIHLSSSHGHGAAMPCRKAGSVARFG